ncbi:50S ribosomal protein L18 [bacterium]|nr:50S ribosomal protein L18 [bacterium]
MIKTVNRKEQTRKRHSRLRVKLMGTTESPRLAVYRSTKHIYAQIIDDIKRVTLVSASSVDPELKGKISHGGNIEAAKLVGELIAKRAAKANIKDVVFDRGGFLYHGRVSALADAAREGGLNF